MGKMESLVSLGTWVDQATRLRSQLRLKGAAESVRRENLGPQELLDPLDLPDLRVQAEQRYVNGRR